MDPRLATIAAEIHADPQGIGYEDMLPDCPGHVCDAINARTRTAYLPRMVTARTVMAEIPNGADILSTLEVAADQIPAVRWALTFLSSDVGLDIGHPATQAQITALAAANVLAASDAQALRDMALQTASRGDQLGVGVVTEADLRAAGVV